MKKQGIFYRLKLMASVMGKYLSFRSALLFFSLFFIANVLQAQHLDSLLSTTDAKYPQEKIYLQYDRPYYNPGETIWFKAYIMPANFPATISNTVYAELIDDKGTVLQRKVMPVIEYGAASGFELPDTMKNNSLYVRAYTAWMLNFDSTLQYLHPVRIINKMAGKALKTRDIYTLNFFPEGGDMVASVMGRIAFKATNQDGEPVNISGNITDSKGVKITSFTTIHDGMGVAMLLPAANEKYNAVWKDKKGAAHETLLPAVKQQGIALKLENKGGIIEYNIERPADAGEDFRSFYVVAKMQHTLIYSARLNLNAKAKITAPIPADNLADGIMQVTVFNAKQVPVAERMVFINHNNYSFITDLHTAELNLNKRRRSVLQVDVGDTIFSNLSIAVTDESLAAPGNNRESIFSQLLLSSDLKGNIFNPAQYFNSDEDSVSQGLDLVMMTNAWRRIKWEEIIAGNTPALKYAPENSLAVSGTVYGPSKIMLKGKAISAILKTKSGGSDFFLMPVEQDGTFKSDIYLFDTARLYYQFNADKDKKLTSISSFTFNPAYMRQPAFYPGLLNDAGMPVLPDSATERKNYLLADKLRQQFFEGNKIKELSTVVVKAKVKSPEEKMDDEYTSGFFTGGDGYTFLTANDPFAKTAMSVLDYLKSKVAGMQVSTSGTPSVTWRGSSTSIFLNESPSDLGMVQSISMNDVAMIKVYRPPFFGASGGGTGGAVAIYMKKGADTYENVKGLDFVNIAGYSAPKEFYSPDYESAATVPVENDLRSTLYWNPFLIFDKATRRIMIPFFNNDSSKKIRVIIEGVNRQGQLTREEKVFQ